MSNTELFTKIRSELGLTENPHTDKGLIRRKVKAVAGGVCDAATDGAIVSTTLTGLIIAVAAVALSAGPIAICAGLALPILELANTAIENTVDLASGGERSDLARRAKDAGALLTSYGILLAMVALVVGAFWRK